MSKLSASVRPKPQPLHCKMSYEFLAYNFRCDVVRAHAAQASCTVDWLARGIGGYRFGATWLIGLKANGADAASKLNRRLENPKGGPGGQRQSVSGSYIKRAMPRSRLGGKQR